MKTKVDGILHMSKCMRYLDCDILKKYHQVSKNTFDSSIKEVDYFRDWWWDCVLYKAKHNSKIFALVRKEPRIFYLHIKCFMI